jgi:hypothetical protein
MAVTYVNIIDGQNVSDWATNSNTFGNAVKADIDIIENNITTINTNKISKSDTGIVYSNLSTGFSQNLILSYAKVYVVDTVSINKSNSHISSDAAGTITFNTSGIYRISSNGSITSNNNIAVQFNYNINGTSIFSNPPKYIGSGNQPYSVNSSVLIQVTAGSVFYIEAKADANAAFTPVSFGISVEKTHY